MTNDFGSASECAGYRQTLYFCRMGGYAMSNVFVATAEAAPQHLRKLRDPDWE